jgi:L-arabinokinase
MAPDLPRAAVSMASERVVRTGAGEPLLYRKAELDVGLVQKDALAQDEAATARAWRELAATHQARVEAEARWLREQGARLVLADIPPHAFEAALRAGIPAVGLSNFSWDWIYRHLARREPALAEAADQAARAYEEATLLLELPFAGDLGAFPRRERIPLVARTARRRRPDVRRHLGLAEKERAVLLTFGGIGVPGLDPRTLARMPDVTFLNTEGTTTPGGNLRIFDAEALAQEGFHYVDVVAAADVVVTKPGYGIVTDAIANRTRMVYTDRGDFPEYPVLVEGMKRWLPAVHVSNADLRAGRIAAALEAVMALPFPDPPPLDGAAVAARRLLSFLS